MAHAAPTTVAIYQTRLFELCEEAKALRTASITPGFASTPAIIDAMKPTAKALEVLIRELSSGRARATQGAVGTAFAAQSSAQFVAAFNADVSPRGFADIEAEATD
jgi:hypothetical protein